MAKKIKEIKAKVETTKQGYSVMQPIKKVVMENFSIFDIEKDLKNPQSNKDIVENQELESNKDSFQNIESNKHCGAITNFDRYLAMYSDSKADFTVVSYGVTRKIIYGKYSFIFNGLKGEKKPLGTHLISLVKRDIDKLIESVYDEKTDTYSYVNKNFIAPKIPDKKPYLTFIHHKNLDWFGIGQEALAIDMNHCYWRTIFLLGRITEETYLKGIEKSEYKDGRLIAVGTLGKILTVRKYKNGEKVEEYVDDRDYLKYGGFFWEVICKVYALLLDLWQNLKEDFLMFLTDCVVIDSCKRELAMQIIEKHGYGSKEYKIVFTEITDTKVAWITDKGEKKHIVHNHKLLNTSNKDFKNVEKNQQKAV